MWFHCSPFLIPDGDLIQSPDVRSTDPISWGDDLAKAEALGICVTDRVFVYSHETDDASQHFNIAKWATPGRYYYEVEPKEPLEADPSPFAPENFQCCTEATVIRCVYRPETPDPTSAS